MTRTRNAGYGGGRTDTHSLLTVADVERYLNTSRSTVYRLIREGALRPVYFDDRPRFVPDDVWSFVVNHRREKGGAA